MSVSENSYEPRIELPDSLHRSIFIKCPPDMEKTNEKHQPTSN